MATTESRMPGPLQVLTDREQESFLSAGRRVTFARDDVLMRQGDEPTDVLVLLEGRVRAVATSANGKEVMLALGGPGDFMGELSVLDGRPRTATVEAMESGVAVRLPAATFRASLPKVPRLAIALLQLAAIRLRRTNDRVIEQVADDIETRLARRLLEVAARHSVPREDGSLAITMQLTQEQLATWIGATRSATARSLGSMRDAGVVEVGRGQLAITDLLGLRGIAGY